MADATHTWTLDTGSEDYVDINRVKHRITVNQTMQFYCTDLGTTGEFVGTFTYAGDGSERVMCDDGFSFIPNGDKRFTFYSGANATEREGMVNGEVCFEEASGAMHVFRVKKLTMADSDGVGANNITSITLESTRHGETMTWTNINTA